MSPEHAEARYYIRSAGYYRPFMHDRSRVYVVREWVCGARKLRPLELVASCCDSKAANAARRLLSGECEVLP